MKVIVIGAGVAGLATGWRLAQRGVRVTVLERGQPARAATWAAAGMIAAASGNEEARAPESELAWRSRERWPEFAREVEEASGRAIDFVQDGALAIGGEPHGEFVSLTADEARALSPLLSAELRVALFAPKEARVDNRKLGDALAVAFARAGGTLVCGEDVTRVEVRASRAVRLRTAATTYEADAFVLAAGAWSGTIAGLPPEALPPVRPVKGEMLALQGRVDGPVVWGNGVYLVPRGDRLLIGATLEEAGFDASPTEAARAWLLGCAVATMPALAGRPVVEHWAGLRPASPDGLPILGESAVEGLFVATGQYRNGILFAPLVAEILSRSVLERPNDPNAFDPRRFAGPLAPSFDVR